MDGVDAQYIQISLPINFWKKGFVNKHDFAASDNISLWIKVPNTWSLFEVLFKWLQQHSHHLKKPTTFFFSSKWNFWFFISSILSIQPIFGANSVLQFP